MAEAPDHATDGAKRAAAEDWLKQWEDIADRAAQTGAQSLPPDPGSPRR